MNNFVNVDHHPFQTGVDDLPNEMISAILGYLSVKDRFNVRQLNRRWYHLSLTGISKLIIRNESFRYDWIAINSVSKFRFFSQNVLTQCHSWLSIMAKQSGRHSLTSLDINLQNFSSLSTQQWMEVISTISHRTCPNIVRLSINIPNNISLCSSLYQHYGHQLEAVRLDCLNFPDPAWFAIRYFNPNRLQELWLDKIDQPSLAAIVTSFPRLSKFQLMQIQSVDLNLNCLQKLTNFQQFRTLNRLSDYSFQSLMIPSVVKKLRKLVLMNWSSSGHVESFESFRNLICLQSLKIKSNSCLTYQDFGVCALALKHLPHLFDLNLTLNLNSSSKVSMLDLQILSQMNKLKRLKFAFFTLNDQSIMKFGFHSSISLSITHLSIKMCRNCSNQKGMYAMESINQMNFDVQNLATIFPNLIHLRLKWMPLSMDALLQCLNRMTKLQSLTFRSGCEVQALKNLCDRKGIVLIY